MSDKFDIKINPEEFEVEDFSGVLNDLANEGHKAAALYLAENFSGQIYISDIGVILTRKRQRERKIKHKGG
jgi:N-dimethylarginine dimethylaminohydrolase